MTDTPKPPITPYAPVRTGDPGLRIAHALEHIASEITLLRAKLEEIAAKK
jgi:hypothetical protein